ncbi:pyridoxamine 5'-phosphate oxidase family protein [Humibacter soli]
MDDRTDRARTGHVSVLSEDDCWRLMATQELGRLAIAADRIEIFPVNFLVHERAVYFASAPGAKLAELIGRPEVAFEADGEHEGLLWSVVLRGRGVRLAADSDIESSGILTLRGWHPTVKHNYVRIAPGEITGRAFRRAA